MNALQFTATGDLAHLSLVEVPVPVPSAGEVLVQINAAGLNPQRREKRAWPLPLHHAATHPRA